MLVGHHRSRLPPGGPSGADEPPGLWPGVCLEAEPEAQLHFDDLPGEPRNADLAVLVHDEFGEFVMTVEGKADESFGDTVAETLAAAVERKLENPASQGVRRSRAIGRRPVRSEEGPESGVARRPRSLRAVPR